LYLQPGGTGSRSSDDDQSETGDSEAKHTVKQGQNRIDPYRESVMRFLGSRLPSHADAMSNAQNVASAPPDSRQTEQGIESNNTTDRITAAQSGQALQHKEEVVGRTDAKSRSQPTRPKNGISNSFAVRDRQCSRRGRLLIVGCWAYRASGRCSRCRTSCGRARCVSSKQAAQRQQHSAHEIPAKVEGGEKLMPATKCASEILGDWLTDQTSSSLRMRSRIAWMISSRTALYACGRRRRTIRLID
jgi:hypothetical protein